MGLDPHGPLLHKAVLLRTFSLVGGEGASFPTPPLAVQICRVQPNQLIKIKEIKPPTKAKPYRH